MKMSKVVYARKDMRTKHGVLYVDYIGKRVPKWTIVKAIYDKLSKKNKKKWIKIKSD